MVAPLRATITIVSLLQFSRGRALTDDALLDAIHGVVGIVVASATGGSVSGMR